MVNISGYTAYEWAVFWDEDEIDDYRIDDYLDEDEIAKVIKTKATALGSSEYCNKTCW